MVERQPEYLKKRKLSVFRIGGIFKEYEILKK